MKKCLTCAYFFENEVEEKLSFICVGNDDLYGKEVDFDFSCNYWHISFDEFVRIKKKIPFEKYYTTTKS